ncbi:nitroreductase family protein [Actinocrinis puniceicyclus]|uniref:Nitroreductase family protein n=1 Tax=Actinocrinis puniceicyclus TaxID=977794 RepID=A0A8J8BEE7_9ACTN|nr:nitroreductase family protein [Actinocrinis puniceicyclus]MBS2965121.1 nitroreductase family protein [Actinocrinis puniceicyclus]
MELQDAIRTRRMVRSFDSDRPVPAEALARILHNGTRAPSAGFSQGQAWLVLREAELEKFWQFGSDAVTDTVRTAPLVIVPFSCKRAYLDRYAQPDKGWTDRDESRWPVPFWHIDTGMAVMLQLLTAVDEGLGALYFGIVPDRVQSFKDAFGVPDDYEPIGAVAIGYDTESEKRDLRARRRPIESMVHYGMWSR